MKRHYIAVLIFASILALGVGTAWIRQKRAASRRILCLSILRSTGAAIAMYRLDNNGELPTTFSAMSNHLHNASWYICPKGNRPPGAWSNIDEWMDYFYLCWPSPAETYTNYPLMYDRRLSNHGGKGINVLLVEQTVNPAIPPSPKTFHGQFFWDEGAQWLKTFAREHPQAKIPMPEDLREAD